MQSSKHDVKHMSNLIKHMTVIWKWVKCSHSKANNHPNMQPIMHNGIRIYACPTHKHDAMRTTKHHKAKQENKQRVKQTKQGFLIERCLLPLGICISPMAFSTYECAHEPYRNDDTLRYTL